RFQADFINSEGDPFNLTVGDVDAEEEAYYVKSSAEFPLYLVDINDVNGILIDKYSYGDKWIVDPDPALYKIITSGFLNEKQITLKSGGDNKRWYVNNRNIYGNDEIKSGLLINLRSFDIISYKSENLIKDKNPDDMSFLEFDNDRLYFIHETEFYLVVKYSTETKKYDPRVWRVPLNNIRTIEQFFKDLSNL
ncbi:MAG: hypothetical protein PHV06_04760, partial [bacterium]|nr:hypothetical protein [bacterium]